MKIDTCYTFEGDLLQPNCIATMIYCASKKNYQKRFVYLHTLSLTFQRIIWSENFFHDVDRAADKMKLKVLNSCASMHERLKSFLGKKNIVSKCGEYQHQQGSSNSCERGLWVLMFCKWIGMQNGMWPNLRKKNLKQD